MKRTYRHTFGMPDITETLVGFEDGHNSSDEEILFQHLKPNTTQQLHGTDRKLSAISQISYPNQAITRTKSRELFRLSQLGLNQKSMLQDYNQVSNDFMLLQDPFRTSCNITGLKHMNSIKKNQLDRISRPRSSLKLSTKSAAKSSQRNSEKAQKPIRDSSQSRISILCGKKSYEINVDDYVKRLSMNKSSEEILRLLTMSDGLSSRSPHSKESIASTEEQQIQQALEDIRRQTLIKNL